MERRELGVGLDGLEEHALEDERRAVAHARDVAHALGDPRPPALDFRRGDARAGVGEGLLQAARHGHVREVQRVEAPRGGCESHRDGEGLLVPLRVLGDRHRFGPHGGRGCDNVRCEARGGGQRGRHGQEVLGREADGGRGKGPGRRRSTNGGAAGSVADATRERGEEQHQAPARGWGSRARACACTSARARASSRACAPTSARRAALLERSAKESRGGRCDADLRVQHVRLQRAPRVELALGRAALARRVAADVHRRPRLVEEGAVEAPR